MASKQSGAGSSGDENPKLEFKFKDLAHCFTLIVDSRLPDYHDDLANQPVASDFELLVPRTIVLWSKVMYAYLTDSKISKEDDVSVLGQAVKRNGKDIFLSASTEAPYVTVWNYAIPNTPKIFVNTRDLPSDILAHVRSHVAGIANWNKYCSLFGMVRLGMSEVYDEPVTVPDFVDNNTLPLPHQSTPQAQQGESNKSFPIHEAHRIRQSRWFQDTKAILLQEFVKGKPDESRYQKIAAQAGYTEDWTFQQYEDKSFVAYRINGALKVSEYNGNLKVDIPVDSAKWQYSVWVKPNDDKAYDWKNLRDVLGIGKEGETQLAVDQELYLDDECFLVVQCNNSKDGTKQYKNFYNIYYAPDTE